MSLQSLIILILVGLLAGWLAGQIWKGSGFGLLWNIIIGVAGSFLGTFLFRLLTISITTGSMIHTIFAALVGALIILFVANLVKKNV